MLPPDYTSIDWYFNGALMTTVPLTYSVRANRPGNYMVVASGCGNERSNVDEIRYETAHPNWNTGTFSSGFTYSTPGSYSIGNPPLGYIIGGEIVVQSGCTLTIAAKLNFNGCYGIKVENGGYLIIGDNSILSSTTQWKGVLIEGGGKLLMYQNSYICDAQFIEVFEMPKALLSITVNKACLNDNLFSIKTNSIYSITDSLFQNINWGDGQSNSFKGNKETTYSYSSPGQYRMVLISRTNKNCIDSNEFIAKVYPNPTSDISVKGICLGDSTTLLSVENGTAEVVNWQWQSKEFNLTTEKAELKHRFSKPGEYKVKVLAISDNGCFAIDSTNLEIWNKPKAEFSYVHFDHASSNIPFLFTDNSLNSDGRLWIFSSGDTSLLKTLQYEFSDTGFYKITLIASLAGKCFDSASILLPVYRSFEFYFPNVFSPDRNQINESFGLSPSQIFMVKEYRMRIFNRWGEKVFDSDNSSIHWTGVGAEQGVYIYKTEIRDIYNVFHEIKGRVELLR